MRIRWGRAIVAVLAAEVVGVLILAGLVAAFGPGGYERSLAYANGLGLWVGPISGFVLIPLGAWWTARAAEAAWRMQNAMIVGVLAAALDLALAAALGAGLVWLLIVSNALRLAGAAIGGWLAARRPTPSAVSSPSDSSPAA
ncbi:MAG: hypothetical protein ABIT09_08840 [Croceibacterium sp.]